MIRDLKEYIPIAGIVVLILGTSSVSLAEIPTALGVHETHRQTKSAPALDELANISYRGIYDEPVKLEQGVYEGDPFVAGGAARPRVELVQDFVLTGDLDDDGNEEAVVLLSESSGGSSTNLFLAVVGWLGDTIVNLGTALVGDRAQVIAARLPDGQIELDVVQVGPEDAACCPSQKATRTWTLREAELKESGSEITGKLSLADLMGPVWVLTSLGRNEKAPPEPEITLIFEGQRVTGKSGCNHYFAQVEGGAPGEMRLGPVGSTRRACPKEVLALEKRYLQALGGAVKYSFLGGRLAIAVQQRGVYRSLLFESRENQSHKP
jgi:heat shock protein HslJ